MSIIQIPLNTKGKTIAVNGYQISISQWDRIVSCAHSLYENGTFNDDEEHDIEYRCSEIIENLRSMSNKKVVGELESSIYDPQVDALFETFCEEIIESFILYGEKNDWDFDLNSLSH